MNFCGFNYNLKQKISQRGINDHLASFSAIEGVDGTETEKDLEDSNFEQSSSQLEL